MGIDSRINNLINRVEKGQGLNNLKDYEANTDGVKAYLTDNPEARTEIRIFLETYKEA